MSIRISLDNAPDFFTNLDIVRGRIVLGISKLEQVGAIVVKLEGESKTALTLPPGFTPEGQTQAGPGGSIIAENHKILYKIQQVFPKEDTPPLATPLVLAPGQHEFPFQFKLPINNICGDPEAMAKISGYAGAGGYGAGPGIFGIGGVRVMDGSRQLLYRHVRKTLPPSFTGMPRQAEIRYYIKVTIQRPGLFKENWRYQIGFKFLPIEPPRPPPSNQEAYARRPFTFRARSPGAGDKKRRSSMFDSSSRTNSSTATPGLLGNVSGDSKRGSRRSEDGQALAAGVPPSIEMSARLPYPSILTCNRPVPLRLIAKKLAPSREQVFLVAFQIDLIGTTHVRCNELVNDEKSRWIVAGRHSLAIPISAANDPVGHETPVPDSLWRDIALPNTVMPSFVTCNLSRDYQLEIKLGLSWGLPPAGSGGAGGALAGLFGRKNSASAVYETTAGVAQVIHLPLHFSSVEIYSGLEPPAGLVEAVRRQQQSGQSSRADEKPRPSSTTAAQPRPGQPGPPVPPRRPVGQQPAPEPADPLYPPQLRPDQNAPPYDDAPPSYDEAMAAEMTGPVFPEGQARPGYSGVTDVNAPSILPEKR